MRVLITGSEGFIGSHMVDYYLDRGDSVAGIDLDRRPRKCMEYYSEDISDYKAWDWIKMINPNLVIHLAAQPNVEQSWKEPGYTMDVNVRGTINVLEAVKKYAPESRVVIAGSAAAYAPSLDLITEDHPLVPSSPYGISKAAVDMLGRAYKNVDVVIARYFNQTGPRKRYDMVSDLVYRAAAIKCRPEAEQIMKVGNLNPVRDITDYRDTVRATALLAEKGERNHAYNICRGEGISVRDVLDLVMKTAGIDVEIEETWAYKRMVDETRIVGDGSKARDHLKYYWRHDISETIQKMMEEAVAFYSR